MMPAYWQFAVSPEAVVLAVDLAADDPSGWRALGSAERVRIFDRLTLGASLDEVVTPRRFTVAKRRKTLPDVFMPRIGFNVVSARFRELLETFDLGDVEFAPVEVLRPDGEPFADGYSIINVRNRKDTLVEAKTPKGKAFQHRLFGHTWRVRWSTDTPPTITLSAAALEGPDLWREAREVELIYASSALQRACETAKIKGLFAGPVEIDVDALH